LDSETDCDGIENTLEGIRDNDSDVIVHSLDFDSDNDGLPTVLKWVITQ